MNDKFFEMKKEKQDKIINGALKIFSKAKYLNASTDDIIKEAKISKGLLFHYFESKVGVYEFIFNYSVRFVALELNSKIMLKKGYCFELYAQLEEAHGRIMTAYPYMLAFLQKVKEETDTEIKKNFDQKEAVLEEKYREILSRADFTRVRNEIEPEDLEKLVEYMLQGITKVFFAKETCDIEALQKEKMKYLAFLEGNVTK